VWTNRIGLTIQGQVRGNLAILKEERETEQIGTALFPSSNHSEYNGSEILEQRIILHK
jgi:hypothetical protein